jgi:hypothetical protein
MTKDEILKRVTEKEIMEYYLGYRLVENKPRYRNPLRVDTKGTCYTKYYNNKYMFVDPADNDYSFDCFKLVMDLYNLSFRGALNKITKDLSLISKPVLSDLRIEINSQNLRRSNFKVITRNYNNQDLSFWQQFGITLSTLEKFNVKAVKEYYSDTDNSTNMRLVYKYKASDPCYLYFFKKRKIRVKLYRPLNKEKKWASNTNIEDVFGHDQLPEKGELLIIASGLKDLMCLYEAGFNAVAPQSESIMITENLINEYFSRFDKVISILDNDNTGVKYMQKYKDKYNIDYIVLPDTYGKDVADLAKHLGVNFLTNFINNELTKQQYSYC